MATQSDVRRIALSLLATEEASDCFAFHWERELEGFRIVHAIGSLNKNARQDDLAFSDVRSRGFQPDAIGRSNYSGGFSAAAASSCLLRSWL